MSCVVVDGVMEKWLDLDRILRVFEHQSRKFAVDAGAQAALRVGEIQGVLTPALQSDVDLALIAGELEGICQGKNEMPGCKDPCCRCTGFLWYQLPRTSRHALDLGNERA